MYHEYFGLKEPAFSIAVNPKYLYMSRQHKEALAHLIYGVKSGGFVLLSGEVGTGKTTMVRCLLDQLPEKMEIALVLNPMASVHEMLETICEELGVKMWQDDDHTDKSLTDHLYHHLLSNHAKGINTVLLIDEAQLLSAEVLEQIRLLTNLETNSQKLLQIVLVGQPELNDLLAQPRLRQLSQRITARFHLEPLTEEETQLYIQHRLRVAGKKDGRSLFPPVIIRKIHRFSGGVPRLINILCERLLIGAYGHNKYEVDEDIYNLAHKEVEGNRKITKVALSKKLNVNLPLTPLTISVLALIVIIAGVLFKSSTTLDIEDALASGAIERELKTLPRDTGQLSHSGPTSVTDTKNYAFSTQATAIEQLFHYNSVALENTEQHPCWYTASHGLTCENTELTTWKDLEDINRPAILSLITEDKTEVFALVTGIDDSHLQLINSDGKTVIVPRLQVSKQWSGKTLYLWRKPEAYQVPVGPGSSGELVGWVAKQFALLDQQISPLTRNNYNDALYERVKIFQTEQQLESDGILGARTIMKLNEALGLIKVLETDLDREH